MKMHLLDLWPQTAWKTHVPRMRSEIHHCVGSTSMLPMGCVLPGSQHSKETEAGPVLGDTGLLWLLIVAQGLATSFAKTSLELTAVSDFPIQHFFLPSALQGWYLPLHLHFFLNWSKVDLRCCVSFRWTAKWFSYSISLSLYLYICIFFFRFFSIICYYKMLDIGPCAIQ